MLLQDKIVLVAGIGPGLGQAIARKASDEGANVALVSRTTDFAREQVAALASLGRRAIAVQGDLTSPHDCRRIAETVAGELGGLDAIVYNAFHAGVEARVEDADLADWRRSMDVNAFGALELVRACLASLRARRGAVVLVNSRQIRRLGQPRGGYAMSKAALFMAGQILAHELGPQGIRVNSVVSGWMWGPTVEHYFEQNAAKSGRSVQEQYDAVASGFALRKIPLPEEVAEAVVFLASSRASAITGQSLDVNAGESFH